MKKGFRLSGAVAAAVAILMIHTAGFCSVQDGDGFMEEGQYRKAIVSYEDAFKETPDDEGILAKLGRAYDGAKWYGMSVETWEKYLEKFPDGPGAAEAAKQAAQARRWIGSYFYYSGEELGRVIPQLEKALGHDPGLFDANYWLGRVLLEKGDCERAAEVVKKAAFIKPKDRNTEWLLKEAEGCAEHGGAAYEHYRKGYGFYEQGKLGTAMRFYREATEANPNFARAYYWMARIHMERGEYEQASENWEKVLEIDPGNSNAKWFLESCRRELAAAGSDSNQ
ncbi:MAG: tetratricopeptide repeat protein [bacterium]